MKTEVLIVPNDTVLVDVQSCELGHADPQLSAGFPPTLFADVLKSAYVSAHCAEGWATYERGCSNCSKHGDCDAEAVAGPHDAPTSDAKLRVVAELLANGVGGRLEPLFPAPDDLFVDPGPRDAVRASR